MMQKLALAKKEYNRLDAIEVDLEAGLKWMKTNKPETFKCDMHETVKKFLIDFNLTKNN